MNDDQQKVHDLIEKIRIAMLTTEDGGHLESRPMTPLRVEDDLTVLFITPRDTEAAQQSNGKQVNLAYADKGNFVSLSGTGEVIDSVELKRELWNVATDAYSDQGPEDPANVVLAVHPESASYWESASAPVTIVNMIRAAISKDDKNPHLGEHDTVEL